ncbi:hypothetical protein C0993_000943 [Termitomyces sp. T159_Od127]|nr:hypothetical protein C0993_000943 [Termitomyces sp. T159_Od127]
MVVSTSLSANNGPIHENEKRRKQTVERARQKQNLNEVENLYFHHSHQRIPKPLASPPMITATLNEPSTTRSNAADSTSNSSPSSPSSRIQPSSLTRNTISLLQDETTSSASTSQFTSTNNDSLSSQSTPIVPTNPVEMRNLIQIEVEPEHRLLPSSTPATLPNQYPEPTPGPSRIPNYGTANYSAPQTSFGDHAPVPTPVATTWVTTSSRPPPTSSPSNFNHHPSASLQRTPTLPVSPGLSESSYNFSGVSLTYDSFWSSHSSSASSRSLRASLSSIVPVAAGSVDSNGAMTDIFMFKSYQASEPAAARGSQGVGVRATAGKD